MPAAVTPKNPYTAPATDVDDAAKQVGDNFSRTEDNLFAAYALRETASQTELKSLATKLGVSTTGNLNIRSLQIVAEQRFQHASQVLNLFSGLLDKVDQLKQRMISKFTS